MGGRVDDILRVTLPSIRWGVAYGVTLTVARSVGEFGALLVVSGNILGSHADRDAFTSTTQLRAFVPKAAYVASVALAGFCSCS